MLLGRDPGEPPELQLSIEQVRGCGDDPLFLSQIHILIFKAMIIYRMNIIYPPVWIKPESGHLVQAMPMRREFIQELRGDSRREVGDLVDISPGVEFQNENL